MMESAVDFTTTRRVHAMIYGHVQGVWFRVSTQKVAQKLGLNGWVRNCRDGAVELMVGGEVDKVAELLTWCHTGPELASVVRVDVNELDEQGDALGYPFGVLQSR